MDLKFLKEIKFQFEEIGNGLITNHLHCRFLPFDSLGATLERRLELRRLLLEDLDNTLERTTSENLFKNESWREKILMPGGPPSIPNVSISISHCSVLGGFIFSFDKNVSIGLDMEKTRRVDRPIQRLSSQEELEESPANYLLWVAKEAAFKCIPFDGTQYLLSDLFIFDWKKIKMRGYQFQFQVRKKNVKGIGGAFVVNELAFGQAQAVLDSSVLESSVKEQRLFASS